MDDHACWMGCSRKQSGKVIVVSSNTDTFRAYSKLIFVEILYYFIGIFHDIFMNFVENLC